MVLRIPSLGPESRRFLRRPASRPVACLPHVHWLHPAVAILFATTSRRRSTWAYSPPQIFPWERFVSFNLGFSLCGVPWPSLISSGARSSWSTAGSRLVIFSSDASDKLPRAVCLLLLCCCAAAAAVRVLWESVGEPASSLRMHLLGRIPPR